MISNALKKMLLGCLMTLPTYCFAADAPFDAASTVWIMISAILVLIMFIPGLALFYGGMIRAKNVLSIFSQFFAVAGVVGILWVAFVYSCVADTSNMTEGALNLNSFIGGLSKAFFAGINDQTLIAGVPEYVLATFGLTFAMITPCIALGGFAERIKFGSAVLFSALWLALVYGPLAHMVWGGPGAIMHNWGVLDFAGGTAVHINSGVAALVGAIVLGKRRGWPTTAMPPHNLVYTMIGAALLWVGWFGFNVGSALAANSTAGLVLLTTMIATCGGIFGWMLIEKILLKHVTSLGLASGAIAGLVGITPAAAYVGPLGAIAVGIITSICCFFAVTGLKRKFGFDDALDVFALHGVGGMVGCILTGIFCIPALGGNQDVNVFNQVVAQISSILLTVVYCGVFTFIIMKIIDKTIGLRVSNEAEQLGLDLSDHNERAYND
ncbi:ammonium transporter [Acinetobacter baumannii]|uniref:Ammonium transporter n=1 Tax=Acinetobacter baumannii TaxID=470 RepID=A0A505MQG2_ACIBA|nr:ammonium transporter [Acinetobacter baumannii]EJB8497439.1 ammonium transporter [Acinetobacter baumannii]ELB0341898.1 ammonium transporter [Acinetobacter baumannii]KCY24722.1 ammonium transporter family protein [Acinetobacter baumannii 233846]MCJ8816200.1 ammonium transporter [Acinetobacter baumannii]MCJ8987352.1 ammonium transporter [Acinetobacter baumannii]